MVHKTPPENFKPQFEVVSCYMEWGDKILLLQRNPEKSQGGKWGLPAGKIESGEDTFAAMVREVREETGLHLKASDLTYLQKVFVRYPEHDFVYHVFRAILETEPAVVLSIKEHQAFCFVTPTEALEMNLVDGNNECIKMSYPECV
ncbi:MAG: NUDIX hydrolase [Patescibacteria group bacterium]